MAEGNLIQMVAHPDTDLTWEVVCDTCGELGYAERTAGAEWIAKEHDRSAEHGPSRLLIHPPVFSK